LRDTAFVGQAELLIAGLLVAVAGLSALARRLSLPYPIVLVAGGALFGFVPGVPAVKLDPNIVLVVFLPPLVYGAAFFANLNDLRANLRPIALISIGLVLLTMGAVAVVAHALVGGLSWAAAFTLGAIVSPTDPLAAGLIMRRLDVPRRIVSMVEGEGLFNDATALVLYRVAVTAVVAGTFSVSDAGLSFVADAAGGIAIGLAIGWLIAAIRARTTDAQVSITISLLSGYAAFVPADALGASGVLAAVTTGIYMGVRGPSLISARTRLQGFFVWDILTFLINATLFVLVGLQLRMIVDGLSGTSAATLAGYTLAVSGAVIAARLFWVMTAPYVIRALDRRPSQRARRVGWRLRVVTGWSGMRGAVSLAAALAVPLQTHGGAPFPKRDLIVFLTFGVILATLVLQGLSLPAVIRRLGITDAGAAETEELRARLLATKAALAQIDALATEDWTRDDTIERMRALYEYRKRRLAARAGKIEDDGYEDRALAYQQVVQIVLAAQRDALVQARHDGTISNETMNRVIQELDLEESRLEIGDEDRRDVPITHPAGAQSPSAEPHPSPPRS
jgi:monovalent cation/hydrogen antiporter